MAWNDTENGIGQHGGLVRILGYGNQHRIVGGQEFGPGTGRAGDHPTWTPGPRSPLVKLQHTEVAHLAGWTRWTDPSGGTAEPGLRIHVGRPRGHGPGSGAMTSATTSWPGTWGRDEKAAMGLSMSPVLKSPRTSLASDPQTPARIGRVMTQSGRTRRASRSRAARKAARPTSPSSVTGDRPLLPGGPWGAEDRPHGRAPPLMALVVMARIPTMDVSISAVFISMTALRSGR